MEWVLSAGLCSGSPHGERARERALSHGSLSRLSLTALTHGSLTALSRLFLTALSNVSPTALSNGSLPNGSLQAAEKGAGPANARAEEQKEWLARQLTEAKLCAGHLLGR